MSKRIKLKNSTIIITGVLIISIGVCIGFYEYFEERKNKTFSEMNILLYEHEQPENLSQEQIIDENKDESIVPVTSEEIEKEEVPNNNIVYNYVGILEIPKINLRRGFYDLNSRYNSVDYNVTVINGSTFPGVANNNLILAAHSGDCTICYFEYLYKLNLNDVAYINYNNYKYEYKIVDIYEVEKDGTVPIYRDYSKNALTLITCTRNSDTKQTVYILEQTN